MADLFHNELRLRCVVDSGDQLLSVEAIGARVGDKRTGRGIRRKHSLTIGSGHQHPLRFEDGTADWPGAERLLLMTLAVERTRRNQSPHCPCKVAHRSSL